MFRILQIVRDFTADVWARYRGMMLRLAESITRDSHEAEDVAQEVLLILSRKEALLQDIDAPGTKNYIYTVTRN